MKLRKHIIRIYCLGIIFIVTLIIVVYHKPNLHNDNNNNIKGNELGLQAELEPLLSLYKPNFENVACVGHINPDTDSVASAIAICNLFDGIPAVSGKVNKETQFCLHKYNIKTPNLVSHPSFHQKNWVLVDHSSKNERHDDISSNSIVAIFDHHQLSSNDLHINRPIDIYTRPFGSTNTLGKLLLGLGSWFGFG